MTASKVAAFQTGAAIKVYLWTGYNESDYLRMLRMKPHGMIVDDAARYKRWLKTQTDILL
jgi:hypothetical protein